MSSNERNLTRVAWCLLLPLIAACALGPTADIVEQTSNQATLARIAMEDQNGTIRSAAVRKLTDQAVLARIALEDSNPYVREDAIARLTDQSALAKVAVLEKHPNLRRSAVEKLSDQTLLERIALEDRDTLVHRSAVRMLRSQTVLEAIAIDDRYSSGARDVAITKLTDQPLLARIAVDENYPTSSRYIAITKLTDQALLARIALTGRETWIRESAVDRLVDQDLLAEIALQDASERVRLAAAARLAYRAVPAGHAEADVTSSTIEKPVERAEVTNAGDTALSEQLPGVPVQYDCARKGIPYIQTVLERQHDDPEVRDNEELVERIERRLDAMGYHAGRIDGKIDDELRAAIRCFHVTAKSDRPGSITRALLDQLGIDQRPDTAP